MFHAMTTGAINTEGREYEHVLLDIETLNKHVWMELTKFLLLAYIHFEIADRYHLMNCGASGKAMVQ